MVSLYFPSYFGHPLLLECITSCMCIILYSFNQCFWHVISVNCKLLVFFWETVSYLLFFVSKVLFLDRQSSVLARQSIMLQFILVGKVLCFSLFSRQSIIPGYSSSCFLCCLADIIFLFFYVYDF